MSSISCHALLTIDKWRLVFEILITSVLFIKGDKVLQ